MKQEIITIKADHGSSIPNPPFAWGVGPRLGVAGVLIVVLWLGVGWAFGWTWPS
ncbi:MAG: hypothetical protein H7839_07105 [Magnetococcus sp. YQC-5]